MDPSFSTSYGSTRLNENVDWTRLQFYDNLAEMPFISSHRQSGIQTTTSVSRNTHVRPNTHVSPNTHLLQNRELQAFNTVKCESSLPLHMIVSGTAGTGKSFLINCLKSLLQHHLCVTAITGVASYNIEGHTLHSLFSLLTKSDCCKDLH